MKYVFISIVATALITGAATNGLVYQSTQGKMIQEEQQIANLTEGLKQVTGSFSELQNSLNELKVSLSTLGSSVSSLDTGVAGINNKVGTLEAGASTLAGDIDSLKGSTSALVDDINSLKGNSYSLTGVINSVKISIAGLDNSINVIQSNVSNLQGSISGLQEALPGETGTENDSVVSLVAAVVPSIIRINTNLGSGSGSIIRTDGYVLTNYHVIQGASSVTCVLSSGDTISAKIVATNQNRDLAVLKLNSSRVDFPAIKLGISSTVKTGENVLALGFPLGSRLPGPVTVTSGIISAVRTYSGYSFLQMDAAINPGNSGGALVNMKGELIGINSAILLGIDGSAAENLGLAVPIDEALSLIQSATGS